MGIFAIFATIFLGSYFGKGIATLEGIRTEMARLVGQSYPTLPLGGQNITSSVNQKIQHDVQQGNIQQENNCKAIALAQQMHGWFETLGYRFERYEIWQNDYFEWIINIPVRRNRYDQSHSRTRDDG